MSEKAKVPQWVADWITAYMSSAQYTDTKNFIAMIVDIVRGAVNIDVDGNHVLVGHHDRQEWLRKNWVTIIQAAIDGCEVEEPRFRVMVLPGIFLKKNVPIYSLSQELFTTHFDDPMTIWTVSGYKLLLSINKELKPFLPPFAENDPHFEKVEDDDE